MCFQADRVYFVFYCQQKVDRVVENEGREPLWTLTASDSLTAPVGLTSPLFSTIFLTQFRGHLSLLQLATRTESSYASYRFPKAQQGAPLLSKRTVVSDRQLRPLARGSPRPKAGPRFAQRRMGGDHPDGARRVRRNRVHDPLRIALPARFTCEAEAVPGAMA